MLVKSFDQNLIDFIRCLHNFSFYSSISKRERERERWKHYSTMHASKSQILFSNLFVSDFYISHPFIFHFSVNLVHIFPNCKLFPLDITFKCQFSLYILSSNLVYVKSGRPLALSHCVYIYIYIYMDMVNDGMISF